MIWGARRALGLALVLVGCGAARRENVPSEPGLLEALAASEGLTPAEDFDEEAYFGELARLYTATADQDPPADPPPDVDGEDAGAAPDEFQEDDISPYQEFGSRIVWYRESGFVMKPFSFPVGMGKRAQELLVSHGGFKVHAAPVDDQDLPDPDQVQAPDSVVLHLLNGYDSEAFAEPRIPGLVSPTPVPLSDWLVVTARPQQLRRVRQFLNAFLADVRQIEIEAKIVEVATRGTFDYGIQPIDDATPIFGLPRAGTLVNSIDYSFPNTADLGEAIFGMTAVFDGVQFNALLELVVSDERVSIISRPKVAVREGGRAEVVNITKKPVLTLTQINANGNFTSALIFQDVGVQMYVVPRVIGRDTVILNIDVEASVQTGTAVTFVQVSEDATGAPRSAELAIPEISRRRATTTVRLEPGQAVVLGGLISERTLERERKIPILGDIPLLGYLFKSRFTETQQTNVLFFIRPRILQGIDLNPDF